MKEEQSMRVFKVVVNGKIYEVGIEELPPDHPLEKPGDVLPGDPESQNAFDPLPNMEQQALDGILSSDSE